MPKPYPLEFRRCAIAGHAHSEVARVGSAPTPHRHDPELGGGRDGRKGGASGSRSRPPVLRCQGRRRPPIAAVCRSRSVGMNHRDAQSAGTSREDCDLENPYDHSLHKGR